jgi:surfeit locus 1 family protein
MSRRQLAAILVSLAAAALFARLGAWQLSRHVERREFNRLVASRVDSLPVPLEALPTDTALTRFRRVRVAGTFDWEHQVVLASRSRNGSPGVYLLAPLRRAGRDTAVLVYRGWVYSPDALRVDLARWREPDSAAFEGFVLPWPTAPREGSPGVRGEPRALRWLDAESVRRLVPYPLAPYTLVALGDSVAPGETVAPGAPARLEVPPLDAGPHRSYAVQWFAFAAIALVGGAMLVRHERRDGRRPAIPAPLHGGQT